MGTFDAVIFDLFGTLIDNASPEQLVRLFRDPAADLNCDPDEFMKAWLGIYQDRAIGRLGSVENEISEICGQLGFAPTKGQLQIVLRRRLEAFKEQCRPRITVLETLAKLKSMGVKTGLVTDCGSEVPDVWPELELAPLMDATVFSCHVGATKPDQKLYKLACKRLGVTPSKCLYVGDGGSRELTGAREVGMTPVLIHVDYEQFFDAHRQDAVGWTGPIIGQIDEVLEIVDQT